MKFPRITLALLAISGLQNESLFGEAFHHTSYRHRRNGNIALRKNIGCAHSHESRQESNAVHGKIVEEKPAFSSAGNNDIGRRLQQMGAGIIAATAISFAAATSDLSQIPSTVANAAELSLSKGAIVIELTAPTTTSTGDDIQKRSELKKFDASQEQKLLQTLIKNRKELGASIGRIQQSIQNELQISDSNTGPTAAKIWTEIYQEILSIEGDVVPKLEIIPPADLATTLKDLREGKLNLLVNGEIINVSVEPTFGKDEDDLIIRIKGFKGGMVPRVREAPSPSAYYGPIRSWLSQFRDFWVFWDSPTTLFSAQGSTFLSSITNGEVVFSGFVSAVILAYVVSYTYYVQQNEAEAAEAAASRAAIAEKAKQKQKVEKKPKETGESDAKADSQTNAQEDTKQPKAPEDTKQTAAVSKVAESTETAPSALTTTKQEKKRRHRFRFWKNR